MSEREHPTCPTCEGDLHLGRDVNYARVYTCEECGLIWNEDLTRKAHKWTRGVPEWEEAK